MMVSFGTVTCDETASNRESVPNFGPPIDQISYDQTALNLRPFRIPHQYDIGRIAL